MLAESREACKRIRTLGMLRKTVATHRLKELRHLRAVEKLAAWRRSNGFDRCDVRDGQWIHSSLPPTPEETTASMWADVNALKKEGNLDVIKIAEIRKFPERTERMHGGRTRDVRKHDHGEEKPRCGACGCCANSYNPTL